MGIRRVEMSVSGFGESGSGEVRSVVPPKKGRCCVQEMGGFCGEWIVRIATF